MNNSANKCIIVAELGINHNGDMGLARQAIVEAKKSGADAIKFQNYRTEDFLSDSSLTYCYQSRGLEVIESQFEMFKRCELSDEQVIMLADHCREHEMLFFSTPTNPYGVRLLKEAGAAYVKNGSDYLTNIPLIQAMAESGLPTILSTGMAVLGEIDDAVTAFKQAGGANLTLLHCTSSYPTPPNDVNLRRIKALELAFGCPAGFSDHTDGIVAALGAVSLGACMLEKHFTLDKKLPGPDHHFSMDPAELALLVNSIRTLEAQIGESAIGPTASEHHGRSNFRLSCVAARDLAAGHCISEDDIVFRRPGTGFLPKLSHVLIGLKLTKAVSYGDPFQNEHFISC